MSDGKTGYIVGYQDENSGLQILDVKVNLNPHDQLKVENKKSEVEISKQELNGDPVVGATLRLAGRGADGKFMKLTADQLVTDEELSVKLVNLSGDKAPYEEEDIAEDATEGDAIVWITGEKNVKFVGLKDGTYTLRETVAPEDYTIANPMTFIIENGQLIEIDGEDVAEDATAEDKVVTMFDASNKSITISKRDITGSRRVIGATLKLTWHGDDAKAATAKDFPEGEEYISLFGSAEAINTTGGSAIVWKSGNRHVELINLPDGYYRLHEEGTPPGYSTAEDIIFKVEDMKVVTAELESLNNKTLETMDSINSEDLTYLDTNTNKYVSDSNMFVMVDEAYIEVGKIDASESEKTKEHFYLVQHSCW